MNDQSGWMPECREGRHRECDNPFCECDHHWYVQEGEKYDLLCTRCRHELHLKQGDRKPRGCPNCGDQQGVPADLNDTVTLTLTTHELRILTIWAANHAEALAKQPGGEHSPRVVYGILDAITTQGVTAPLSMRQEIADLREAFGDVEVRNSDGSESDL